MKGNIGKWIAIIILVVLLVILIRGYILKVQEANEDKEIENEIKRAQLNQQ